MNLKAFSIAVRKSRLLKKLTQDELGYVAGIPGKHISNIDIENYLTFEGTELKLS